MKHLLYSPGKPMQFIILLLSIFAAFALNGQAPQAFKYQAVVRHSDGQPISSQNVSVQISILGETPTGTAVYVELHNIQTSLGGLITFNIGGGNKQPGSGEFDEIYWGLNEYFVKVEVDPQGGSDYIEMGTSQLLSVPYALYAKESGGTPSYKWGELNGAKKIIMSPAPGSIVYVSDRHQMAYFDGNQWILLVGCPDNTPAIAGENQFDIIGTDVQLNASSPGFDNFGTWSVLEGIGGTFSDIHDPVATFTGVPGSAYTFKWTISTVCESNSDTLMLSFCYTNTLADAGPDQLDIIAVSVNLIANEPDVGNTGQWSVLEGIGGQIADPSANMTTFTGIPGNSYILSWAITSECDEENHDNMNVSFCYELTIADAGDDQINVDGTTVQLSASAPLSGNIGTWSVVSGVGGSFTNENTPATEFQGQPGEDYELSWTITANCDQSSVDFLNISFCPLIVQAVAGDDVMNACNPVFLQGNDPGPGNTGFWQIISGIGGQIVNPESPVTEFFGQPGVTYILSYTISNACSTTVSSMIISFEQLPTLANAGPSQLNINGTSATLQGNNPEYGTGSWTIVSGYGGEIQDASNPTTLFTGQPGITYELAWTISNNCGESTSDNVMIGFCPVLVAADAGEDTLLACDPHPLDANQPGFGNTGTWLIIAGAGGTISDIHDPNASFSGSPNVNYILQWTISNACGSSSDMVTISFEQNITIANAGSDQLGIEGTSTTLDANMPKAGAGLWTILSGEGGNVLQPSHPKSAFTGLQGQIYQLEWSISNPCYTSADIVTISFVAGFLCGDEDLIDTRDGQVYPTVQIGNQCWMAKNLNIGTMVAFNPSDNGIIEKYCYGHIPANCDVYGGLYRWDEMMNYETTPGAQGICPDGWYIPSQEDFTALLNEIDTYDPIGYWPSAGGYLKETGTDYWNEPNAGATNSSGFTAYGGGWHTGATFFHQNNYGAFWSSSRLVTNGRYLTMNRFNTISGLPSYATSYSLSVRCIKNQ